MTDQDIRERLTHMSADDFAEALTFELRPDSDDAFWVEICIRLGVEGANGIRLGGPTVDEPRLRAYTEGREHAEALLKGPLGKEHARRMKSNARGMKENSRRDTS